MTRSVSSSTAEMLQPIWARLLEGPSITAEDNFFARGGNPAIAVELFEEIAKITGRELPPTVIYQAPTVASLAALLEQSEPLHSPPLVVLKPGTEPPIFVAHGIGGTVLELFQLVDNIDLPNAIYGTQAMGIDGIGKPLETIEGMAKFYLNAIQQVQPRGPYFLIGHSLGGLVALEMAQQLTGQVEQVALLAMLDSYPHAGHLPIGPRARLFFSQTVRRASSILHRRPSPQRGWTGIYRAPDGASFAPAMCRVRDKAYTALKRYRPRFYAGSIKFLRAEVASSFPSDPVPVWAHLTADLEIETVPGNHLEMLTTHFQSAASILTRHLQSALCLQ
jgi:thioesterase domain-containing protein